MSEVGDGVLVVGEVGVDGLRTVSQEILAAGRRVTDALGGPLTALVMGHGVGEAARRLAALGADRVLVADDERLKG
ncbi:MAG: electron transfer flavoprotein subunit alpha/FixB family protein, partial [Chloroflexota bacterium]|nr:electron transfer flavoprotein subunit alpha/FixB family protein [Chloroflexota bacterium]